MAGAGKKRQQKERKNGEPSEENGTNDKSSNSPTSAQQTSPQQLSPPAGMDGNRDPSAPRERTGSDAAAPGAPGPSTTALPVQRQSLLSTTNKNLDLGYAASALMSGVSIDPILSCHKHVKANVAILLSPHTCSSIAPFAFRFMMMMIIVSPSTCYQMFITTYTASSLYTPACCMHTRW